MKKALLITRYFVGILFIFSGLIKANDPLGLSYKMQEFFEVWNLTSLNDFSLILSIIMISFEIIAGVAVIIGWEFRLFSWLLFLLIVFFTFLTGYAVLSGKIRECGCFGDCIKLKADQSFMKDLILLVLSSFLLYHRRKVTSIFKTSISILFLSIVTIGSVWIQMYAMQHLPIVDCLPFKKGAVIQDQMKIPAGAIPDSTVINFVYTYNNKQVEFDAEHFPADFNDSAYVFVKRYDKLVREGNAKPAIKDFVILTESGIDSTEAILNTQGKLLILFIKKADEKSLDATSIYQIKRINVLTSQKSIPFIAVSSDADRLKSSFLKNNINIQVCKGDQVAIKTAARSNPTIYLLEKGKILNKWGRLDLQHIEF